MREFEERALQQMKDHIHLVAVPSALNDYIRKGMEQGKRKTVRQKKIRFAAFAACFLFTLTLFSTRFSPALAAYVGKIPGLEAIVKLITYDKGLQLAAENQFMQPLNVSDEHAGIKLTADGIIVDESRLFIFYTIDTKQKGQVPSFSDIKFTNQQGEPLKDYSFSWGAPSADDNGNYRGMMDLTFTKEFAMPDEITMKVKIQGGHLQNQTSVPVSNGESAYSRTDTTQEPNWELHIPIDKTKFVGMKETYVIDQTAEIEGQKITFNRMTVYPTRVALEISYDPNNSKKILAYDDLRVTDENGDSFGTIKNGVLASKIDEQNEILYLQSNYFKKPKHLYITANSIKALDKDKLKVIVDTKNGKLLQRPDDLLNLAAIQRHGVGIDLHFTLKKENSLDSHYTYHVFSSIVTDATGRQLDSNELGMNSSDNEIGLSIQGTDLQSPISLTIDEYPTRIQGDLKLQVK